MSAGEGAPLAIIAGGGSMPLEVAEEATRNGWRVHVAALHGAADPVLERYPHVWVKFGEIGKLLRHLEAWSCRRLMIVGSVVRPQASEVRFDLGALASLPDLTRLLRGGDDGVLGGVVRFFEGKGYEVCGVLDVAPGLAAGDGALTRHAASAAAQADIAYGMALLTALSPFDVGQAAVVIDGRAVAIEGVEGTDAMLERVADLRASGRLRAKAGEGVLVKAPKRGQSLRVDLPAIGPRTVEKAAAAGLAGIAVAAGQVLVVERGTVVAMADDAGLFLCGAAGWSAA